MTPQHVRDHLAGTAAAPTLSRTAVLLLGHPGTPSSWAADALAADLRECGVGTVLIPDDDPPPDPPPPGPLPNAELAIAVVLDRPDNPELLAEAAAAGTGVPVLRCAWRPGTVELGPLFQPGCVPCFRRLQTTLPEPSTMDTQRDAGPGLLAALLAQELLALWAALSEPATTGTLVRFTTADLRTRRWAVPPCPHPQFTGSFGHQTQPL